jgi:predicted GNAT superfamily acetyltransferase
MNDPVISLLETPEELVEVEDIQRVVWPGSETEIVPATLLMASIHHGGVLLGARIQGKLVAVAYGFPAIELVPDGPILQHHSHILAVLPEFRSIGLGFTLKRAQWQVVRRQGIQRITWTYDPLLSRNAHLNISRLGAVCNTYLPNFYGEMKDGLNRGLPSDRFLVDWWLNTPRVETRLGDRPRAAIHLVDFEKAQIRPAYQSSRLPSGLLQPPDAMPSLSERLILAEIPADFMALKSDDNSLALAWRHFSRTLFEKAFSDGYIITDFIYDANNAHPRSFYVLTHGESTLDPSVD